MQMIQKRMKMQAEKVMRNELVKGFLHDLATIADPRLLP